MAWEMGEETREVPGSWDVSSYRYKIEDSGLRLLCDAMKEKKFRGIRCHECGTVYVPGPTYCRKCFVEINEIVDVGDAGEIMSYAVEYSDVRGNPLDNERVSAMIQLDGSDSWFVGIIEDVEPDDVHVGMRVKAEWIHEPQGNFGDIARFVPE